MSCRSSMMFIRPFDQRFSLSCAVDCMEEVICAMHTSEHGRGFAADVDEEVAHELRSFAESFE